MGNESENIIMYGNGDDSGCLGHCTKSGKTVGYILNEKVLKGPPHHPGSTLGPLGPPRVKVQGSKGQKIPGPGAPIRCPTLVQGSRFKVRGSGHFGPKFRI